MLRLVGPGVMLFLLEVGLVVQDFFVILLIIFVDPFLIFFSNFRFVLDLSSFDHVYFVHSFVPPLFSFFCFLQPVFLFMHL